MEQENKQLGINRHNPEFNRVRRKRFEAIIRDAKGTLKLLPEERKLVIELANLIAKNTEGM